MGREIYVVTHGDYEDYRIAAAFDDKSLADQLAEQLHGSVETYRIKTTVPKRKRLYFVATDEAGNVAEQYHTDHWDFEPGPRPEESAGIYVNGSGVCEGAWAHSYRGHAAAVKMAQAQLSKKGA